MKDQTRNIETFKVGATRVNEFDFHKHQSEMHEHHGPRRKRKDGRASARAEQVAETIELAHKKVARRKKRR
jgi:hypothetical protein